MDASDGREPGQARDQGEKGGHELPHTLRRQLTVAVPLAAGFVVLLSSFVVLWVLYPFLFEYAHPATVRDVERRVAWVFAVGGAFALVGLAVAIAVAEWIARPLRSLVSRMESVRRAAGAQTPPQRASALGDPLHTALKDVVASMAALVQDSYVLRSLEGGVVTLDQGGVVTSFSPVAERVLGCPASEAIGRRLSQVVPDEAANAPLLDAVSKALAGGACASSVETTVRTRDGRSAHLGYTLSPLRDERGAPLGILMTFKDLAQRKAAEQVMRQAESLAVLGSMALRLAHEIANPLTAMSGLVELIRDAAPPDSPIPEHCRIMLESIGRLKRICKELLTIGNPEPRKVEPVDVNALVRDTVALCRHEAGNRGIPVSERYAPDLPPVAGDRERLAEVVLNILRNAYQAVRAQGGEIALATARAGSLVTIAIENTGPPIPPEVLDKLFTPFFTTRSRGAGLGLAMSQQLVKAHGGQILVDSGPGRNTTFTIQLPVAGPPAESVEP